MEENKSFFDFDETLIRINSFPYWILFVISYSALSFDFKLTAKFSKLLFERKIRKNISHYNFKKELLKFSVSDNCNQKFAGFLSFFTRKELINELRRLHVEKHKIVISSAAPENYLRKTIELILPEISDEILIIGSKPHNNEWVDNYKEYKLQNLYKSQFLHENEILKNVYTDSWDDSALAYKSENIILISPSKKSKEKYFSDVKLKDRIRFF
ncbi:HAD family hydrolase [Moheibacter sediminis]|uniref:Haloacid dehalogenase-like hydrolase n=1 Tax=Moheibacter sediminis TaxID=1434700 RepID=A0A1W1Z8N6_9FLAO|nr:haloacid dehalogenase-like hydrolase [Moheibacter sediminis]SMC44797.1 haloacid dehalogenase-like hydrolase [Moheibacter sediminis]